MSYMRWAALAAMSLGITACSGDDGGGEGGGASGSAGKGSGGVSSGGAGVGGSAGSGSGGSAGIGTGGSSGGSGPGSAVATHICSQEIECGYQLADQELCVELFDLFFNAMQLEACDACVSAEDCDTQQDVCTEICSI